MTRHRRLLSAAAVAATSVLALTACASAATPSGAGLGAVWPDPPVGTVVGQGTVMDAGGSVELCLGPIAESYPPQCSGIPVDGWTWDGVDGAETAGGATWGAYAVQGAYDGERFRVEGAPIPLALYDPIKPEDPTGGESGEATDAQIASLQDELPGRLGDAFLGAYPDRGWLHVDVVWDDGTWQDAADDEFGTRVVLIRSALRELD